MINADSHASSAEDIARALANELETLTQVVETLDIEHDALMGSDAQSARLISKREKSSRAWMLTRNILAKDWRCLTTSSTN